MQGTLVLAILSIKSSYLRNVQAPADDLPDTVQFWLTENSMWRVRTFAMDHDIHVYSMGDKPATVDFMLHNNQEHFGEVLAAQHVLRFQDCTNPPEVRRVCAVIGRAGGLEIAVEDGFAFWKPDDAPYFTQSEPRQEPSPAATIEAVPPTKQKVSRLGKADRLQLEKQEAAILRLLRSLDARAELRRDATDLPLLQRLLDEQVPKAVDAKGLHALGIVFGQALAAETGLQWVQVEDDQGRSPALQYPGTSVLVFPETMISKRIEDGEPVDLVVLFKTVKAMLGVLKETPEFKK